MLRVRLVALTLALLLAGCSAPAAQTDPPASAGTSTPERLEAPRLLAPVPGARSVDPRVVAFSWSAAASSAGVASYDLVLAGSSRSECRGVATSCAVRGLDPGRTYSWHVVVRSTTGRAAQSDAQGFTTNAPPVVSGALANLDGLEQVPLSLALTWGAAYDPDGDAVHYALRIQGPGVPSAVACSTSALRCDVPQTLRAGGRYQFTLDATDALGLASSTTATVTARRPVVLVHGYMGDSDTWRGMLESLVREGHPVLDFDASAPGVQAMAYDSIMDGGVAYVAVGEVAPRIDRALVMAGFRDDQPIDIVAHSMGGLVSRWLIEQAGETVTVRDYEITAARKWSSQVRTLVTLATPHHGSNWDFCFTDVCEDMAPGSGFLEFLGYEPRPASTRYFTAGGGEDAVVSAESARLSTSDWTYIPGACHMDSDCRIVGDPTAQALVKRALGG